MRSRRVSKLLSGANLRRLSVVCLISCVLLCICAAAVTQNPKDLKPQGYVNDFANVLSQPARQKLTDLCAEVDLKTQAQIAIVTIKSLGGRPIDDYTIDLAQRWGVGPKQKDRGVMILLAVDDHKYRFEVGYGLEGILPDGKVGGFGREAVPLLRENNYDAAVLFMTRRVADVIAADRGVTLAQAPPPTNPSLPARASTEAAHGLGSVIFVLVLVFVIFRVLRALIFRGPRGPHYRGGGWWIGPMMGGWGGGGFGGGGWGGSGWSSGHGDGFGGFGGGSFGGGGASGSW